MAKASVIKGESGGEAVSLSAVFSLSDIARQAEQVLAAAQEKGRRLLAEAQTQAKALTAAARNTGRDAGYAEGLAAGRKAGHDEARAAATQKFAAESASVLKMLGAVLEQLEAQKLRVIADALHDQLALAHAIAEKVTRLRVELDGEAARANLEAAVRHVAGASNVVVRVNPADLEAAETFAPQLVGQVGGLASIDVQSDASISRGGCLVRYGAGRIDAGIDTQLALIARQLLGAEAGDAGQAEGSA
jgi:flagellar biosynthesis/type III secretory pathway protein FliH